MVRKRANSEKELETRFQEAMKKLPRADQMDVKAYIDFKLEQHIDQHYNLQLDYSDLKAAEKERERIYSLVVGDSDSPQGSVARSRGRRK